MARKYAQIQVSIWSDEDFKALDPLYQHMYFVLLSQPRMNLCGVIDFIPTRIARVSDSLKPDEVEQRVKWLDSKRYIVVDDETSELLIRSFVRNDGMLRNPKVSIGMATDFAEVMSQKLRDAIVTELRRCYQEDSESAGWKAIERANPVLYRNVTQGASK